MDDNTLHSGNASCLIAYAVAGKERDLVSLYADWTLDREATAALL